MSTRIGLISDLHAAPGPVKEALQIFHAQNVDAIYCAGDIAGYGTQLEETVALLIENQCRTVLGNHDLWHLDRSKDQLLSLTDRYLDSLPFAIEQEIAGKQLYLTHASPDTSLDAGIRLLDEQGEPIPLQRHYWSEVLQDFDADILVVGHTHQVFVETLGGVVVINPGSTLFNHTCATLTLPEMTVQLFPLSGKQPILSWNFSLFKGF